MLVSELVCRRHVYLRDFIVPRSVTVYMKVCGDRLCTETYPRLQKLLANSSARQVLFANGNTAVLEEGLNSLNAFCLIAT